MGIIVYHDNDIANGTYSNVGDIKMQGEIFNRTGTGGNVTGDHLHLEIGKGEVDLVANNRYHFTDFSQCERIVPDSALYVNDTIVTDYPRYDWKEYQDGITPTEEKKKKFKWVLYANKIRKRNS